MSHSTAIIAESNKRFGSPVEPSARELAGTAAAANGEDERQAALRLLSTPSPMFTSAGSLPSLATAGDVREAVRFLQKRPAGVNVIEAQSALKKPIFDARKVAAYEFWGLVTRDGERLRLSALGREFARVSEPVEQVFRRVLRGVEAYHAGLMWIDAQALEIVTHTNIIACWREDYPELFAGSGEKDAEATAVSFFHLCQAAGLGWLTIGKRGQPARLRVEREELTAYLTPGVSAGVRASAAPGDGRISPFMLVENDEPCAEQLFGNDARQPRVYVSGTSGAKLTRQLRDALALAGIESEAGDNAEDDGDAPPRTRASEAMRRCEAGVFVITATDRLSETEDHRGAFDDCLLMEMCAAYVLYDRRAILLCESGVEIPSRFRELLRVELRGEELTWEAGVQLLKALKSWQQPT